MSRRQTAERIAPDCPHFGTCGGCTTLDVNIDEQLENKRRAIDEALRPHLGEVTVDVAPPPRVPLGHRTKLLYPAQPDRKGRLQLGLYASGSHDLVPIERCRVQHPALTKLGREAEQILRDLGQRPYDERTGDGFVRAVGARIAPSTGELLIGLVTRGGEWPDAEKVSSALFERAQKLRDAKGRKLKPVGVVRVINDEPGNALVAGRCVPVRGRDYLVDAVDGLRFRISFPSFYQVHRAAPKILYEAAFDLLGDLEGKRVVDGYGGVGTFGLRAAKRGATHVESVELHPAACRDAETAVQWNELKNRVTVRREAFDDAQLEPADICIVDPPRKGLGPGGVEKVRQVAAPRVLLVACSLQALRRDVEALSAHGYRVTAVRLADLFPHTEHVEVLCRLDRP